MNFNPKPKDGTEVKAARLNIERARAKTYISLVRQNQIAITLIDKNAFDKKYSIVIDKNGTDSDVYVVRTDENGKSSVIFGDGKTGGRLPSGNDAIDADYRKGYGGAGNVLSEQPKGTRVFSSRKQAIKSLGEKIVSDLMAKLSEEQGTYIVYLDVWKKDLTCLDDPTLRETALEGAGTSTRTDNAPKPKKISLT